MSELTKPEWLSLPDGEHFMCRVSVPMGDKTFYIRQMVHKQLYEEQYFRDMVERDLLGELRRQLESQSGA